MNHRAQRKTHSDRKGPRPGGDASPREPAAGAADASESSTPSAIFDEKQALGAMGGDRKLLRELAATFQEEGPRLLREVRAAIDDRDPERLRHAAHTLKSGAGLMGSPAAHDAAFRLEQLGHQGDLQQAHDACRQLADLLPRLLTALARLPDESSSPGESRDE